MPSSVPASSTLTMPTTTTSRRRRSTAAAGVQSGQHGDSCYARTRRRRRPQPAAAGRQRHAVPFLLLPLLLLLVLPSVCVAMLHPAASAPALADGRLIAFEDDSAVISYVQYSQAPVLRGREGVGRTGNYVDLAICIASWLGSLTIILPYVLNRAHRKLRHALILGLATSDLISSSVIIISTSYLITHDHADKADSRNIGFAQAPVLCDILGFLTASSIFTQHLWNLAIATVTYSILVFPLATFTITIERRIKWLWPIFWLIAAIMHAVIWGVIGYTDIGGYCQIAPTKGGLTAPLIQFVPRSLVVVTTIILYAHLFVFLRRTNLFSKAHRSGASAPSKATLSQQRMHGIAFGSHIGQASQHNSNGLANHTNNPSQGIYSALNSIRGGSSHADGATDQGSVGRRPSHVTGISIDPSNTNANEITIQELRKGSRDKTAEDEQCQHSPNTLGPLSASGMTAHTSFFKQRFSGSGESGQTGDSRCAHKDDPDADADVTVVSPGGTAGRRRSSSTRALGRWIVRTVRRLFPEPVDFPTDVEMTSNQYQHETNVDRDAGCGQDGHAAKVDYHSHHQLPGSRSTSVSAQGSLLGNNTSASGLSASIMTPMTVSIPLGAAPGVSAVKRGSITYASPDAPLSEPVPLSLSISPKSSPPSTAVGPPSAAAAQPSASSSASPALAVFPQSAAASGPANMGSAIPTVGPSTVSELERSMSVPAVAGMAQVSEVDEEFIMDSPRGAKPSASASTSRQEADGRIPPLRRSQSYANQLSPTTASRSRPGTGGSTGSGGAGSGTGGRMMADPSDSDLSAMTQYEQGSLYERRRKRREREASLNTVPSPPSTMSASMSMDRNPFLSGGSGSFHSGGGPGQPPAALRALSLGAGLVASRVTRPRSSGNPSTSAGPGAFGSIDGRMQSSRARPHTSGEDRRRADADADGEDYDDEEDDDALSDDSILHLRATMPPRKDAVDFQMNSPPQEHLSHFTGGVVQVRGLGVQAFKSRISRAVSAGAMAAHIPWSPSGARGPGAGAGPGSAGAGPASAGPFVAGPGVGPLDMSAAGGPSPAAGAGMGFGGWYTPPVSGLRRGSTPVQGSPGLMGAPWSAPPNAVGPFPGGANGPAATPTSVGAGVVPANQPIAIAPTIAANTIEMNRQRRRKASEAAKRRIAVGLDVEESVLAESGTSRANGVGGSSHAGGGGGGFFRSRDAGVSSFSAPNTAGVEPGSGARAGTPTSGIVSMTAMEEFEAAMGNFQWGMDVTQLGGPGMQSPHGTSVFSGAGGPGQGHVGPPRISNASRGSNRIAASWMSRVTGGRRHSEGAVTAFSGAGGGGGGGGGDRGGHENGVATHNSAHSSTSMRSGACVESLGSTLNRQASILMLLYPMAYVLLFSVSIIRIVVDLADPVPVGGMERRSQRGLHSVARWFIFAQGVFDAIIFQVVERHFRSRMKRRRKEALGEPVPLTAWQMLKLWTKTLIFGHGPRR
ncbi:hypothetical protein OC835_004225 [Tilletia horrida]|nr:hypothetical protein OC835_004225 [Tilletia horrida]